MPASSVNEIRQELKSATAKDLMEICLRLVRFKKDNKELVSYILFDENDLSGYLAGIKETMDLDFSEINQKNIYLAKKSLRKILRGINKYIRYTGSKTAEAELLLHYLTNYRGLVINWKKSPVLLNIYQSQLKKANAAIAGMHEDLQWEYQKEAERLEI